MNTRSSRPYASKPLRILTGSIAALALSLSPSVHAASQTWDGEQDADWTNANNWVSNAVPGEINPAQNALNQDVVTFNAALNGTIGSVSNPILNDANRNVRSILFDTANAGAYVIGTVGGNALQLTHNGNVTVGAGVVNAQTINAPITIRVPNSTDAVYTFLNNASNANATLTLNSVTSGASNTRPLTVNLDGSNTGANTLSSLQHGAGLRIDLVKSGTGTWILSGSNDFGNNAGTTTSGTPNAGSTTINAGKLIVTNNAALSTNSTANGTAVNINAGTLEINGAGLVMDNGLSFNLNNGGIIQSVGSNSTNGRINVSTVANANVTISAVGASDVLTVGNGTNDFTGGSSTSTVNIGGAGRVLLGGATTAIGSDYAGGISIGNGSTLQINSDTALGAAATAKLDLVGNGKLIIGSTAVRNPTVTALNSSSATSTIETGFTGTSTLTVNNATGATSTFAGVLQNGTGTLALTKNGKGTLVLTGTNTYSGATLVRNGTLNLDFSAATAPASNIAGSTSALTIGGGTGGASGNPGATLLITGKDNTPNTQTFSNLAIGAGTNKITLTPGAGTGTAGLTITNALTTPAGNVHGTLEFGTTGTTTLAGNLSLTSFQHSGGIYATYGTDDYAATNASGVVGAATYVNVTTASAAGINNIQGNVTQANGAADPTALRFADATGRTFTNNDASFFIGSILVASTSGSATFTGQAIRSNASAGDPNRDFNIIQNSANAFTMAAALNNNTTGRNMSFVKAGTGTVILTAANGYSAGTYINEGTVQVGNGGTAGALGIGGVINYGSLVFNRSDVAPIENNVISGTGTVTQAGAGTTTLNGASSFTGNVNINAGILVSGTVGGNNNTVNPATSFLGNMQTAGRSINVNNGGTLRFDAGDSFGGATSTILTNLVINAGGTVTNAGGNFTSLGPVTLNGGTLTGNGGAVAANFEMYRFSGNVTVSGTSASTISGSGANAGYHLGTNTVFDVADATSSTASDLNVSAALINQTASATPANAAGGLTKTGVGTMTLSGSNTYTGATNVNAGRLIVAGSITGSTVNVAAGAVLGSGTAGSTSLIAPTATTGNAIVLSGTLSPGTVGTIAPINLTLQTGAKLSFESGSSLLFDVGASNAADKVAFTAAGDWLTGSGNATLALNGSVDYNSIYTVFSNVNTTGFAFASITGYDTAAYTANFGQVGTDYQLSFQAVPEPSTWAMMIGGVGMLGFYQRLRRNRRG